MTFDPNVPNAGQSPGLFPAQNNTNYARIKTIINADHVFNDSTQTTDGVHKQCTMIARAIPSGLPGGTNAILYSWLDAQSRSQLRYYNGVTDVPITPGNVIAAVNFNGTGGNGVKTLRSTFGVSSVMRTSTGSYTINFSPPLPNANYIVQITGMRNSSGDVSNGYVAGNASYSGSVTTTTLKVEFNGGSSNLQDVLMGNITILSVS